MDGVSADKRDFNDFTEASYRDIIKAAKKKYIFCGYTDAPMANTLLWRHDLDFSVQRALRVAEIEAEENVRSTFFLLLHSEYYNLFEKTIFDIVKKISGMGHFLGLHFDASVYPSIEHKSDLEKWLAFEKAIVEQIFETEVNAFSYHNPDVGNVLRFDDYKIAGMVNAYSSVIKTNYFYCSDSNGYWRYHRLHDVIRSAEHERLHILTHPEWWVPAAMSPRDRVSRCIDGRAAALHKHYDRLLAELGRVNIK
jgi:hypothetical protein